jgi:hypothetical protein
MVRIAINPRMIVSGNTVKLTNPTVIGLFWGVIIALKPFVIASRNIFRISRYGSRYWN